MQRLTWLSTLLLGQSFNPFEGARPLLVFIQTEPWGMVMGAETPNLVIYEGGQVIFLRKIKRELHYFEAHLSSAELATISGKVQAALEQKLKPRYNIAPNAFDLPEAMFYLRQDGQTVATSVYGLMVKGTRLGAYSTGGGGKEPTRPPEALLSLHEWLGKADFPNAKPWKPKYTEVMLWDFSHARKSIEWPRGLPGLDSPHAIKRRDAYSIFLEESQLPQLEKFLQKLDELTAVKIQGKKLSLSTRATFPSEPDWREAFKKARGS